jgi:hypothetical protein
MADIIKGSIVHKSYLRELKADFIRNLVPHMKKPHGYVVLSWDGNGEVKINSDSVAFIDADAIEHMLDRVRDELEDFIDD